VVGTAVCIRFSDLESLSKDMQYQSIYKGLRAVGIMGIIYLLYIFKASDGKGLEVGWWGILGLIGWGYFAAASIFLSRER
jgi:hypothetical protein